MLHVLYILSLTDPIAAPVSQEPAEPPEMDEAAAEAAQKEKEEAEAALKKELGDIEVKSGDYQIQVRSTPQCSVV